MKLFMKHIVSTISVLLLSLSLGWGDDFQKAYDAFQKGEYTVAFEEYKKLAEQGNKIAQYNLGVIFSHGKGTSKDLSKGLKWHTLAAKQGYVDSQYALGIMFDNGMGTSQDYKEAVRWYRLAAEKGDNLAQNNLGTMYERGRGVLQDMVFAHMWYNIAASDGNELASKNRDMVLKKMTPSQIENAQDLARECVKKNYKGC